MSNVADQIKIEEHLLDRAVANVIQHYNLLKPYMEWLKSGKPIPPPPVVKHAAIKAYAEKYGPKIFVETGTFTGGTVDAVKDVFDRIFSIELGHELYEKANARFAEYDHISIMFGDTVEVLPDVLARIKEPCLFWLDAHVSGGITAESKYDPPHLYELEHIFNHPVKDHVILMDDARGINLQQLKSFVQDRRPDYLFEIENDIIRIHKD